MSQTFLYISLMPLFLIGIGIIIVFVLFVFLAPLFGLGSLSMYIKNKTRSEKIILLFSVIVSFFAASYPYWDEFVSTGIPLSHLLKIGLIFLVYTVVIFNITRKFVKYLSRK